MTGDFTVKNETNYLLYAEELSICLFCLKGWVGSGGESETLKDSRELFYLLIIHS